jgi:Fe-S oxidoreductase
MSLKPFQLAPHFIADRCDYCGRCFTECPVLRWPAQKAEAEIRALVAGAPAEVLDQCTGCMACNSICPTAANPHTLILNRWQERYKKRGIPSRAGLVLPYQESNLYTVAQRSLPRDEKNLLRQWERNGLEPPQTEMIYAGCNVLLQPFLMDSPLFRDMPIFGSLKLCCGEPFYRMGCWDAAKAAAENVQREFSRMRIKKVIVPCLAGYHLFKFVYPDVFNIRLDVEIVAIEDWLFARIESGEIPVRPLNMRVVVHDNCWPKASGEDLFDKIRQLLAAIGVTVVEPENTRENALCCGMCAGAARFRMRDIVRVARTRLRELDKAPADAAVNYCGGCNWLFSLINELSLSRCKKPHYHLLELVRMAAGENPARRTRQRARKIIVSMAPRLLGKYIRGGRFWIDTKSVKASER